MSSANNHRRNCLLGGHAVALVAILSVGLGFSLPAAAQTAPAYSDAPAPAAAQADEATDSPESYVGEGSSGSDEVNLSEVLQMLQNGNSDKPLTIAQLAKINDAMKRMDYAAQLQQRMGQAQLGIGGSARALSPAQAATPMGAGAAGMTVQRIMGTGGKYEALLANGAQQVVVREGDSVGPGQRISSITLSGVRVITDTGSMLIPFANPISGIGVTVGR